MNNIDTSDFVLKIKYGTDKAELENEIPDASGIVKKTNYNTKITELENKLPDISNLATKTALTTVKNEIPDVTNLATKPALTTLENKIPDVSSLVKKTDYDTRVAEIDTKVSRLDGKIAKNKNELIKNIKEVTEIGVLSLSMGNAMFEEEDGLQAYLIFQPAYKYFKTITNTNYISSWKSKGLSVESIIPFPTSDNSLISLIDYYS